MAINITQLLQALIQQKGSDLHIAAMSVPMMRLRGDIVKFEVPALTPADVEAMVKQIASPHHQAEVVENKSSDFAFKATGIGVFRVNVFTQRHGLAIVIRALSEKPPEMEDLKLPSICKTACGFANGLVLVTGPTGSGKSTTLAAMINYLNQTTHGHILTLEDPIEFQHESKNCIVNQRSLGAHFTDFASALKAALREDPDVILVGEMRDPETIALAITAAETGHLVFGTMHTNSASKSIDRIIDSFPAQEQNQIRSMLSETLKVVISQKLIPTADKKRRIAIHDIMVNNSAVANLIREGKTFQIPSIMQTGKKDGMQLFDRVLLDLVGKGEVDGPLAFEYCNDKAMFGQWDPSRATAGLASVEVNGSRAGAPGGAGGARPGGTANSPAAPANNMGLPPQKKRGSPSLSANHCYTAA